MKKFTLLFILFFLALPSTAGAVLDQRCFPKTDCVNVRTEMMRTPVGTYASGEPEDGFVPDTGGVCPSTMINENGDPETEVGFCLPVSQSNTEISIGGRARFGNIADYIAFLYKYSLTAGAVLAVMMIIIAGVQYIVSGGDNSRITAARKRISNAIIGLVLIATTYTILNTINPNLIALRLPGIWMIRAQMVGTQYCSDLPSGTVLALAASPGQEELTPFSQELFSSARTTIEQAQCGARYYINGAGEQTCEGTACDGSQICRPFTITNDGITETPICTNDKFITKFSFDISATLFQEFQELIEVAGDLSWWTEKFQEKDWLRKDIIVVPVCEITQNYAFSVHEAPALDGRSMHENINSVKFTYFGWPIGIENALTIYNHENEFGGPDSMYAIHDWMRISNFLTSPNACKYSYTATAEREDVLLRNGTTGDVIDSRTISPVIQGNVKGFIIQYITNKDNSTDDPIFYLAPTNNGANGTTRGVAGSVQELFGRGNLSMLANNRMCQDTILEVLATPISGPSLSLNMMTLETAIPLTLGAMFEYNTNLNHFVYDGPENLAIFDRGAIEERGISVNAEIDLDALKNILGRFQHAAITGNIYFSPNQSPPDWRATIFNSKILTCGELNDIEAPCYPLGDTSCIDYAFYCWDLYPCHTDEDVANFYDGKPRWGMKVHTSDPACR